MLAQGAIASVRANRHLGGHADPPDVLAPMNDGTDTRPSQDSLNTIAVLEFCADALPTTAPAGRE